MFFINNNKAQLCKRCEQSGPGTYHDLDLSLLGTNKLVVPFSRRHTGIQYGHLISKAAIESHHRLIGQSDLRDQHDDLLSLSQRMGDQFHIDFRLTAAGNAMDQIGTMISCILLGGDDIHDVLLLIIELYRSSCLFLAVGPVTGMAASSHGHGQRIAILSLLDHRDDILVLQAFYGGWADMQFSGHHLIRQFSIFLQCLQQTQLRHISFRAEAGHK